MHFVNAIAIIGFTFIIIYKAFFRGIKSTNLYHKGLNYIISGFFVFFLLSSFRGHVQAQWIAPIILPLILITFDYLLDNQKKIKLFNYLALINIIIIITARIIIANEGIIPVKLEFHGNKEWVFKAKELTQNTDRVFINSFQNSAIFWFYTKEKPHYQKNFLGRKNQFKFIPGNKTFLSDSVSYFTRTSRDYSEIKMSSGKDSIFISFIKNYNSLFEIKIYLIDSDELLIKNNSKNLIKVTIENPYDFDIDLKDIFIEIVFQNKKGNEKYSIPTKINTSLIKASSEEIISLELDGSLVYDINEFPIVGIGMRTSDKMDLVKVSSLNRFKIED